MTDLIEKDPRIDAVIDKQSQRNLLDPGNPNPLLIDLSSGAAFRVALQIKNGPEGLINLALSSDQPWLEPELNRLTLMGGESGECILRAKPDGYTEFANLLLSWEGAERTLGQSIMVQRKRAGQAPGSAAPPPPGLEAPPAPRSAAEEEARKRKKAEAVQSLSAFINGCGSPDKLIDVEEENQAFRHGGALGLTPTETESILNRLCTEGGWTRQYRLTEKLTAMLFEATKDDGVIDEQEYEHVVNFAVKRKVPRKAADEHCITLILDNGWKAKEGLLNKWFTKKRKQYGL